MIEIIARYVIKHEDLENEKRNKYGIICSIVGIVFNIILSTLKISIGIISSSISILADGINNLSDASSSVVTLFGFKLSKKRADIEHPFGHGRMEYISGFIVSILILVMGIDLLKSSITKLINNDYSFEGNYLILIILFMSILIKLYMYIYNRNIGKKINSEALKATSKDSLSDCLATLCVLISTIFSEYVSFNLDAIAGIFVSLFIIYTGFNTCKETMNPLLGEDVSSEFKSKIKEIVLKHKEILGMHDLIVHDYGPNKIMITLHAEVAANAKLIDIHEIIDTAEKEIKSKMNCIATIHIDPIDIDNPLIHELMEKITSNIKEQIDMRCSIHDLRILPCKVTSKIIFDVVIPYDNKLNDNEVDIIVNEIVKNIDKNYKAIIDIDRE